MAQSLRRIAKELREVTADPPNGARVIPDPIDAYRWTAVLAGPEESPYEGGFFKVEIIFPQNYPWQPPKSRFITPVYSCDINTAGNHCLDIDRAEWSPALTVSRILLAMLSLLSHPNPQDPLCASLAELYNRDRREYRSRARHHTSLHAIAHHGAEYAAFEALFYANLPKEKLP